jgi:hypothetical protein
VRAEHVRFHERRSRSDEGVKNAVAGTEVPVQEHLDELGNELSEVRMKAVYVLRPFDLRELVI